MQPCHLPKEPYTLQKAATGRLLGSCRTSVTISMNWVCRQQCAETAHCGLLSAHSSSHCKMVCILPELHISMFSQLAAWAGGPISHITYHYYSGALPMVYNCSLKESSYNRLMGRDPIKELWLGYAASTLHRPVQTKNVVVWLPIAFFMNSLLKHL